MGKVFTYFCLLVTFVGLGICTMSRDIIEILADPKFWPAYKSHSGACACADNSKFFSSISI